MRRLPSRYTPRAVLLARFADRQWPVISMVLVSAMAAMSLLLNRSHRPDWVAFCLSSTRESVAIATILKAALQTGALQDAAVHWLLMTLVMAPLLNLSLVRFVAARSFVKRRAPAIAEFLAGLLVGWTLLGLVVIPMTVLVTAPLPSRQLGAAFAFGLAALWQVTKMKRLALRRCHTTRA